MGSKKSKAQANEKSHAKRKSQQPSVSDWGKVFKRARQDLSSRYSTDTVVTLVTTLVVTPIAGALMNSPKTIIIGITLGITFVLWFGSYQLIRHLQLPIKVEPSPTPAPIKSELHGLLTPGDDPNPPNLCSQDLPPGALAVYLGSVVAYTSRVFPYPIIRLFREGRFVEDLLTIDKTAEGLSLTATVRSSDGRVVAQIIKNELRVNPNNYFYIKRPDKHTIGVYDQLGRVALYVRYLTPSAVEILGVFEYPGRPRPLIEIKEGEMLLLNRTLIGECYGNDGGGAIHINLKNPPPVTRQK